jgi:hypothetical protein
MNFSLDALMRATLARLPDTIRCQKKAGSGHSAQNISFKGIAGDSTYMGTPRFKSFSAFSEEIVALINSCNARNRADLMIENFVGDVWSYAKPLPFRTRRFVVDHEVAIQ